MLPRLALTLLLPAFLLAQVGLSWGIRDVRPTLGILPDLPEQAALDALAFGDRQFLFRYLALELQNAGDNGGRVTPLRNYDYDKVVDWLDLLEDLDLTSHWPIAMANGYFGQTPKTEDVEPIIRYMQAHVAQEPERKWPWLVNGIYLARHRLRNDWVALDVAVQLASYDYDRMNSASLQMPMLVMDDLEQFGRAGRHMSALMQRRGSEFPPEDQLWMKDFIALMAERQKDRVFSLSP